MQKETFLTILDDIHNALVLKTAENDEIDSKEVIDFLHHLAKALIDDNFSTPTNFFTQSTSFEEEYKSLAHLSIDSYKSANDAISSIASSSQKELEKASDTIDQEEFIKKFNEIQSHLNGQVSKANDTITSLVTQIKDLELKSNIDPLTKIFNRRAMDKYLGAVCKHEHNDNIALIILDIDDFKQINDNYGHIAGDKVLIFLSRLLKNSIRDNDKLFRFGGEEFLVVLHGTKEGQCLSISERILELTRSNKLLYKDKQIQITISIGLTGLKKGDTAESLISRADKALYEAKNAGKDQIKVKE